MSRCVLIINKADNLIRKCKDEKDFNSDYETQFSSVWYFQWIENKTAAEWYAENPVPTIEVTEYDAVLKTPTELKWLNPADGKWYTLKERPDHDLKWEKVPGAAVPTLADNPVNTETENKKAVHNLQVGP